MRRGTFLKWAAGTLYAARYGTLPDPEPLAAPAVPESVAPLVVYAPEHVLGSVSLVASGGLCAPMEPYYDLTHVFRDSRPVLGALPSFSAKRGERGWKQ